MTDLFELLWLQVGESTSVLRILGTSHEKFKQVIYSEIQISDLGNYLLSLIMV